MHDYDRVEVGLVINICYVCGRSLHEQVCILQTHHHKSPAVFDEVAESKPDQPQDNINSKESKKEYLECAMNL